jgi:hypothetical protein
VVKDADGAKVGCHPSRDSAVQQLKALYANEPGRAWADESGAYAPGPLRLLVAERFNPYHTKSGRFGSGGGSFQDRMAAAATEGAAVDAARYTPSGDAIRAALDDYGGEGPNSYAPINENLRTGKALSPRQQEHVNALDEAMAETSGASRDLVSYRVVRGPGTFGGTNDDYFGSDPKSLTGTKWRDAGFVSTGAGESWKTGTSNIAMRILVPKGTRAISYTQKPAKSATGGPFGGLDFDEVLLDRGLTFRVVADHGFRRTRYDGTPDTYSGRDIDVEIVPTG